MLHANRLALIRGRLQSEHRLRVSDLAKQLDVAEETIRRDLKQLESLGELQRVHGGAVLSYATPDTMSHPRSANKTKDNKLATQAIRQIQDGMSIFLAATPYNLAVAQRLSQFKDLKIFTNALPIAQLLADDPRNQLYIIPGQVRRHDHSIVGPQSLHFIAQYHYDLALMGVSAVSLQQGLMDDDEQDAFLHREIIQYSHTKIIMADAQAFSGSGFIHRCDVGQIDILITNKKPQQAYLEQFDAAGIQVLYSASN